jgi:hypothetical protein
MRFPIRAIRIGAGAKFHAAGLFSCVGRVMERSSMGQAPSSSTSLVAPQNCRLTPEPPNKQMQPMCGTAWHKMANQPPHAADLWR